LTGLANGFANRVLDGLSEDVADAGGLLPKDMSVDAQGDGRVSVDESGGDHVDRNSSEQQSSGVQMTQIMQSGRWQRLGWTNDGVVGCADQLAHKSAHGVGVERFSPSGGEDQAAVVVPGGSGRLALFGLLPVMFAERGHRVAVYADGPRPAALGCSLDALSAYYRGRAAESDFCGLKVR
jgi:hypothetical protein